MSQTKLISKIKTRFPLIILILLTYLVLGVAQNSKPINLDISMVLINKSDGSSKELKAEYITLTTQKIQLKGGDSIQSLLTSSGIYVDAESIDVVYKLNPHLDAKSIGFSSELVVPKIIGGRELSKALEEGYLVAFTVDKELKQRFLNILKSLKGYVEQVSNLNPQHFEYPEGKESFSKLVKYVVESMGIIKIIIMERSRPLSSEILRQMIGEAELLISIIREMIQKGHKLSKSDVEDGKLIAENFRIRMRTIYEERGEPGELPPKWPEIRVIVKIINAENNSEVHNLRVYFVPLALWNYRKNYENSFDRLTSPAYGILPEANYFIWAGKPGDSTPLTDRKKLEVKAKIKEVVLDLVLIKKVDIKEVVLDLVHY